MKRKLLTLFAFAVLFLAACSSQQSGDMEGMDHGNKKEEETKNKVNPERIDGAQTVSSETLTGNEFTIVANIN